MRLPAEDCTLRGLIQTIYLDHQRHYGDAMYLMQRSILAPKNTDVDEVNNAILESLSKELHTYLSAVFGSDKRRCKCYCKSFNGFIVSNGILNTLQFSGIANHKLELKVGVPILLLCNLNQSIRLCNGTKLIIKRLGQRVIEAKIITWNNVGKRVFIPRIIMSPFGTNWPFVLHRRQFHVQVAFAMIINNSQCQTLNNVGVYFPFPVFYRGQLYVVISWVTSNVNIKIFSG